MAKASSKAGVVRVNFGDAAEGGGRVRIPEGDYHMRIKSAKQDTSEKSGNTMIVVDFEFMDKKLRGKGTLRDYFTLQGKGVFKLRDLVNAIGPEEVGYGDGVPKSAARLRYNKLVGCELGVTVTDDEYEGRVRSRPSDYIDLETLQSDDIDDEDEDEEDEDLEEEEDEEEEDEEDEDEEDEEDEEEEDEEEEEEKPRRRKRSSLSKGRSKKSGTKSRRRKKKDEDEDLESLDLDGL